MHEHSPSSEEKYLVRPRLIFTEAFEERIASHELSKSEEALNNSRFSKYFTFVRHYKYAFSYGIAGSLIFGLIGGLICTGFGYFVDCTLKKMKAHNKISAENDEQYRRYKHSFFIQDCQIMLWQFQVYLLVGVILYSGLISIVNLIPLLHPLLEFWYKLINPITLKMASFIPAIDRFEAYLIVERYYSYPIDLLRIRNIMAMSWLITFLHLFLFLHYITYLIINSKNWSYGITSKLVGIKRFLAGIYLIIFCFGGFYILFRDGFLGNVFFMPKATVIVGTIIPYLCTVFFIFSLVLVSVFVESIMRKFKS